MSIRLANDLSAVLTLVRGQLANAGIFFPEKVFITSDPTDESPMQRGDQYALITMLDDAADQGVTAGGDRDILLVDGRLAVTIFNRLALDETPGIDQFLLDNSFGMLSLVRQTINCLHMYDPQNSNGDYFLSRPFHYRGRDSVKKLKEPGWGSTVTYWLFSWCQPLS